MRGNARFLVFVRGVVTPNYTRWHPLQGRIQGRLGRHRDRPLNVVVRRLQVMILGSLRVIADPVTDVLNRKMVQQFGFSLGLKQIKSRDKSWVSLLVIFKTRCCFEVYADLVSNRVVLHRPADR